MNITVLFNPSRLTLARKRRGVTMTRLAKLVGVDLRSISAYEKGEFEPGEEKLRQLAKALSFPTSFFSGDDLEELSPDIASFRSMTKMTARQRDTALGAGAIALMLNEWIEKRFDLPKPDLPNLSREQGPEAFAEASRRYWGLGEQSVKNMVHLLEAKGIRVFSLAVDAAEVDAFSMWHDDVPYVFLNTNKSAEHSRFDAAHELGHLIMHRHGAPQGLEAEREANTFASAFLMPRSSVLAHAPLLATVDHLIKLKKYWNVSVAALTYRLHSIGAISDWHYRNLYVEMSKRGYRKSEPESGQREISQILGKVFSALREDGISKTDIADELNIPVEEVEELVFGLALTALVGKTAGNSTHSSKRPQLRIVS